VKAEIIGGDTLAVMELSVVPILPALSNPDPVEAKRLARLVNNVKRVYPYARLAGLRFRELNEAMEKSEKRHDRREAIKIVEREIKDKYGGELKKLSFTQGKILIKLLDRETGNSSFDLVEEFKGQIMAFFWQGFAKLWGYNLKTKYDPEGEDQEIEKIVQLIEHGAI
jgi:hypothetical protein